MELKDMLEHRSDSAPIRVRVEMGQRVFVGTILLSDEDFRSRLSDVVNEPSRRFLPLSDVKTLDAGTGEIVGRVPLLLVRVDAIDILVPLEEPAERPPRT